MDNVPKETHVVSPMILHLGTDARIRKEKDNRPLLHQIQRQRLTGKNPSTDQAAEVRALGQEGADSRADKKSSQHPSCNYWHPPVSELQVRNRMQSWQQVLPNKRSKKGGRKGSVELLKESIQLGCVSQELRPRKSILWKEGALRPNHAVHFSKGTWHQIKLQRSFCTPKFEERSQEETLHQEGLCGRTSCFIEGVKIQLGKKHVLLSYWSQDNGGANFQITRGKRIRDWFQSFDAHAEQQGFELRRTGNSKEIQNFSLGVNGKWRSVCSRSWPLRGCAITRRYDCSSIARKALRRTRIFIWVGQRSATTVDQKDEEIICKTDPVVPGLSSPSGSSSSSTSPLQDSSLTSSETERSDEHKHQESGAQKIKKNKKKVDKSRCRRTFARSSWMVGGVHR